MHRHARLWFAGALVVALAVGSMVAAERSSAAMVTAANKFLAALTPEQRQQATFAFSSEERLRWHFVPAETFARKGLLIRDMSEPQRALAHDLLKTGLSQRGYMTASQIMELETILGALERAQRAASGRGGNGLERDPVKYFVSIFGTPSAKDTWGWRVEGHHVSLNFNIVNGMLGSGSPSFFGSNPAEVREGPKKGTRILAAEEDGARALMAALDAVTAHEGDRQRRSAERHADGGEREHHAAVADGLGYDAMNAAQRDLLMKLIDVYTGFMAADIAAERTARFKKAGVEKIGFAWAGSTEKGAKHYYRIQGPTFLDRVRQHAERRQPHPLGVARLRR